MIRVLFRGTFALFAFVASSQLRAAGTDYFPQSVASGDPTQTSVVLWTRLIDGDAGMDRQLTLKVSSEGQLADVGTNMELAGSNLFTGGPLTAPSDHDGCVKLRITGLNPGTHYYYQFTYDGNRSAIGRTKTAPAGEAAVRFAVLNCSDYTGRYYNTLRHLCDQESESLDFVLHLGDYIYETIGDPSFQTVTPERSITFDDEAGALDIGSTMAAQSLDNYRQLYRVYREDPNRMKAHELFPWVMIWDDHEFSDDNWRDNATYFDGKTDEQQTQRKRNGEQAWFEFVPCDLGLDASGTGLEIDAGDLYPNTVIYRALNFGDHLDLVVTDNRTNRPDHLIPEDAFPGTVAMTETETQLTVDAVFGAGAFSALRDSFDPYLDIGAPDFNQPDPAFQGQTFKEAVTTAAALLATVDLASLPEGSTPTRTASEYAADVVSGNISASYINRVFGLLGLDAPLGPDQLAGMDRGISFFTLGKLTPFVDNGSRYQLVNDTYQLFAGFTYQAFLGSGGLLGRDQAFYDEAQQTFIGTQLATSSALDRTWRVVASSSPYTPINLELADLPDGFQTLTMGTLDGIPIAQGLPPEFLVRFLINGDEVSGFPQFRGSMIDLFADHDAVLVSGDIHASLVGRNLSSSGESVIDFTAPSASSSHFRLAFEAAVEQIETLVSAEAGGVFEYDPTQKQRFLEEIDRVLEHNTPELVSANTASQGYLVVEAGPEQLTAEIREIGVSNVGIDQSNLPDTGLDALFARKRWTVTKDGKGDTLLERGPVDEAAVAGAEVRQGDTILLPSVSLEAGQEFQPVYSLDLQSWIELPAEDVLAADGGSVVEGVVKGAGSPARVLVSIPDGVGSEERVYFRLEELGK